MDSTAEDEGAPMAPRAALDKAKQDGIRLPRGFNLSGLEDDGLSYAIRRIYDRVSTILEESKADSFTYVTEPVAVA